MWKTEDHTAKALRRAWESLRRETSEMTEYLGEVLMGSLASLVDGPVDGTTKVTRMEGMQQSEFGRGVVMGKIRRQLSTTCIRAPSQCLLDRMHHVRST